MKSVVIPYPKNAVACNLREIVVNSTEVREKRITNNTIHLVSEANYGTLAMVEKEHFQIRGKLEDHPNGTSLSYRVKANTTYKTLMFVLPLMLLPTLALATVGGKSQLTGTVIGSIILCMVVGYWLYRKDEKLRRKGEAVWADILNALREGAVKENSDS